MKISAFITSLFVATSALAGTNVPDTKPDGKNILSATGTPCENPKALALVANSIRHLTIKPFQEEHKKFNDVQSKKTLEHVNGWINASSYTVLPQLYYKAASGPRVSICAARIFVNGKSVVADARDKRNTLRYIVVGDISYLIDYVVESIGPWSFPDPKKEVSH